MLQWATLRIDEISRGCMRIAPAQNRQSVCRKMCTITYNNALQYQKPASKIIQFFSFYYFLIFYFYKQIIKTKIKSLKSVQMFEKKKKGKQIGLSSS